MRTLLALVILGVPLVAAPVPKAVKKAPAPLDGSWEVVEWYDDDSRMVLTEGIRWAIAGEKLSVVGIQRVNQNGFASNATRTVSKPEGGAANALDYTITYSDGTPPLLRPAVFELDGDTLKLCMTTTLNGVRPAECKPVVGTRMYVLKRVDEKAK